jgi:4-oxalocrotonate tautomerase
MPLVRIDLRKGTTPAYRTALANGVHQALVESIGIPIKDRFHVITERDIDALLYDNSYLDISRTNNIVIVQITMSRGRTLEQKRTLYKRMAEILSDKPGLRPQDLFINLVEVEKENWSFGNGEAQYAK